MKLSPDGQRGPTFDDCTPSVGPWPAPRLSPREDGGVALRAFDQFVVKLHSRCNLACDYCYVYELRDSGWRTRPRTMPVQVRSRLVRRIAEHVRGNGLDRIRVILHGGEPLLAGPDVVAGFCSAVREALDGSGAVVELAAQSNGLLLTGTMLDVLAGHGVTVGVSLDGDREAHDRHRTHRAGRDGREAAGSYREVVGALEQLNRRRYRHLFGGLLCTVDTANDPVRTYDALVAHRPPFVDFRLPHATWDDPPSRDPGQDASYGRWLACAFDRWWQTGRPVRVRLFDAIVGLWESQAWETAGAAPMVSDSEVVGMLPAASVVVESDGTISWAESLKAVADGAAGTGVSVFSHSFDAVLSLPTAPGYGVSLLSQECRACPVVGVCGGGVRAHRHGRGAGFDNPSVYCADLAFLIGHIGDQLREWQRLPRSDEVRPNSAFARRVVGKLP
ncbi:FxsB family cyclophane-forming radical SAM/SPASM peptide maturase [Actinacidiphila epipremni]|uniref:FxsB family cyclophane-forming radical SAM/SPASM peptide maturase n=1 Tax=Actinacidiphila epipremni TaxID=2053013 RepID=UPI002AFFCE68|nr:FxsB family cyclophane-forming radical SAM/SPASM peptide maturase [Actinacidiphila epipremni]